MKPDHDNDLPLFAWTTPVSNVVPMPMSMWRRAMVLFAASIAVLPPGDRQKAINSLIRTRLRLRFLEAGISPEEVEELCKAVRATLKGLVAHNIAQLEPCSPASRNDGGGDDAA